MALMIDLHRLVHASGGRSRKHRGVVDCCCDDAGTNPPAAQCQSQHGSLTCVYAGRGEDDLIRSCSHGGGDHSSSLVHGLGGKPSRPVEPDWIAPPRLLRIKPSLARRRALARPTSCPRRPEKRDAPRLETSAVDVRAAVLQSEPPNAAHTPVMTASSYVRVNTKEGGRRDRGRARFLGVYRSDERRNVGGRTQRSAVDDMTVLAARSRSGSRVRPGLLALSLFGLLFLTGCSAELVDQMKRLGFRRLPATGLNPFSISGSAPGSLPLRSGFGVGLILWAANRYKTKHAKMPRQNRYNLPMEIFYTIAPFIIIAVLFYYTVLAQNAVRRRNRT